MMFTEKAMKAAGNGRFCAMSINQKLSNCIKLFSNRLTVYENDVIIHNRKHRNTKEICAEMTAVVKNIFRDKELSEN